MKQQHQTIELESSFSFLSFGFPVLFCLSNPILLSLLFPDLKFFFVQHQRFIFQNRQVKKHQFLVKRGVATKRSSLITCVLQNAKSHFGAHCRVNLVGVWKHSLKRYFSTFLKATKGNFGTSLSGPSGRQQHKNGQLGPDNDVQNMCAVHFFFEQMCWNPPPPHFIVFFDKPC